MFSSCGCSQRCRESSPGTLGWAASALRGLPAARELPAPLPAQPPEARPGHLPPESRRPTELKDSTAPQCLHACTLLYQFLSHFIGGGDAQRSPGAARPFPTHDGTDQHNPGRAHSTRARQQAARGEPSCQPATRLLPQSRNGLPHRPDLFSHRSELSRNVPEFSRA